MLQLEYNDNYYSISSIPGCIIESCDDNYNDVIKLVEITVVAEKMRTLEFVT